LAYNTYDRRVQLGASRHRYEDATFLQQCGRWNGAIYLAGYAIECSLKSLICYRGKKDNLKDTRFYEEETEKNQGMGFLHNLQKLCDALPDVRRAILYDNNHTLKNAWRTVTQGWRKDELRYGHKLGNERECKLFLDNARVLYRFILSMQGESL
jgi:hypothetical protein